MGYGRNIKTEHAGAKNGGGFWGHREDAKQQSKRIRRAADRTQVDEALAERQRFVVDGDCDCSGCSGYEDEIDCGGCSECGNCIWEAWYDRRQTA